MSQAGQALKIIPSETVKINRDGVPDKPSVNVNNHQIVEFRSDTEFSWEVDFVDSDGNDFFPLTVLVPAHSFVWCVANSQQDDDACEYTILPPTGSINPPAKAPGPETNYVIIIGSGGGRPKDKK